MNSLLDKLNLRPQERRLVLGSSAVLFAVLQVWLVRPYFSQWSQVGAELRNARATLNTYRTELARTNAYQLKLNELEGQGTSVLAAEQAQPTILMRQVQDQAERSKLSYGPISPVPKTTAASKTNHFFEEQAINLGVNPTGDDELIDFLVAMGSSDLRIRVKNLDLSPDNTGTKLKGAMVLVASFQKPTASTAAPPQLAVGAKKKP
jgi:hypothetical protein